MRRPSHLAVVAGAAACLALAGGCAAPPVQVQAPKDAPTECAGLTADLPQTVAAQQRRDVTPDGAPAAAWGDPAIVLRCGVARPDALGPSSPCAEVNSVGWFAEERQSGHRFTTIGRSTFVQLHVPYDYRPAADALVDVAAAIKAHVPENRPCV